MEREMIAVIIDCIVKDLNEFEDTLLFCQLAQALGEKTNRRFPQDLFHRSFKAYVYWKLYKSTLETDRTVDPDKPDTEVISATIYALRHVNNSALNKLVADHAMMAELPDKEAEGARPNWVKVLLNYKLSEILELIDGEMKKFIEKFPFARPCGE